MTGDRMGIAGDVDKILAGLSLDQKIGQLWMAGICGGETLDFAARNFERYHFGGLMFSPVFQTFVRSRNFVPCGVCRNIPNSETAQFLHAIKTLSLEIDGIPCIIGGDQEGGLSGSFLRRRDMTILPKPMGLATSPQAERDAYAAAVIAAREVKAMGYDMLYGPVMDVNINPDNPEVGARSFGQDPEVCARLGAQFIKAYADEGVISTAKHFPGRGRGRVDAHYELESFDVDRETLLKSDLLPFRRAVAAGVDAMMTCHSIFSAIDSELPASLSHKVITGLLREEMGFDGVVLTDTIEMWAILKNFPVDRACAMTLEAGGDIFFLKDPQRYPAALAAIKESLRAGRLTEERIEQSVRRVLKLKLKYGLHEKRFDATDFARRVGTPEHRQVALDLARRSTVILKNRESTLPVQEARNKTALVLVSREFFVIQTNDAVRDHSLLPRTLEGMFGEVHYVVLDPEATELQLFEVVARARNADIAIAGVMASGWNPGLAAAAERVMDLDVPLIVLLACGPALAAKLPRKVAAVVCTFGEGPQQYQAFVERVINEDGKG